MTTEQIRRARSLVDYAAVHSLETDEVILLGHALLHIAAQDKRIEEMERGPAVVAPELMEEENRDIAQMIWSDVEYRGKSDVVACLLKVAPSTFRALPSDRVLGYAEIAVNELLWQRMCEYIRASRSLASKGGSFSSWSMHGENGDRLIAQLDELDALRARMGEGNA